MCATASNICLRACECARMLPRAEARRSGAHSAGSAGVALRDTLMLLHEHEASLALRCLPLTCPSARALALLVVRFAIPTGSARVSCSVAVTKTADERRARRAKGVRSKMHGTEERPRLSVYRSNTHMYAQIINDDEGKTLCAYNTRMKDFELDNTWDKEAAELVGKKVAEKALAAGVEKVCFDRSGFKYHGRIASVADGAREGGLKF